MLKSEDEEEKHSPFLPLSSSLPVRSGISIGSMRSSSVSSKSTTVWAPSKSRSNTISSCKKQLIPFLELLLTNFCFIKFCFLFLIINVLV